MPIATRALIENACYHVITRGNRKQKVFLDAGDFTCYLMMLKKAKRRHGVSVYSYCLMPNHVHLLIELRSAHNISKFMQWLNRGYTEYFNKKYDKVGHLWQGRFKSKPIVKDDYLLTCFEYIEANPVRAGLVRDRASYEWTSYKERCLSSRKQIVDDMIIVG